MRIAITFGPLCLAFRKSFDFLNLRHDPRGLSGSEVGFVRIAQCLKELGHDVTIYTEATNHQLPWEGMSIIPLDALGKDGARYDAAVSINEPNTLRDIDAKVKVCEFWLNDTSFCRPDFEKHVDLFISPSQGHLDQMLTNPTWRVVSVNSATPLGGGHYEPDPETWQVIPLGCDPERYAPLLCLRCKRTAESSRGGNGCCHDCDSGQYEVRTKVPGRVVYCSSPDRGLHWLLQEWPHIKRAVPHAHLRIFYRLQPWIDGFKTVGYHPPIEALRSRALYIEEALRRMSGPEWGIEVVDSVSREQIEREMSQAEVLAYPCDTVSWSEGFSCTILEACAARACPIVTDCDGLLSVYGDVLPMAERGREQWIKTWREVVILALRDEQYRTGMNKAAHALASKLTWRSHAEQLMTAIQRRLPDEVAHHPV